MEYLDNVKLLSALPYRDRYYTASKIIISLFIVLIISKSCTRAC